jgi:hypothetical protein
LFRDTSGKSLEIQTCKPDERENEKKSIRECVVLWCATVSMVEHSAAAGGRAQLGEADKSLQAWLSAGFLF